MFSPSTIKGFFDELEKISGPSEQPQMESKGPSELVTTSTLDPLNSWDKNGNWDKKGQGGKKAPKQPSAPPASMAAQRANQILFASDDPRHPDNKANKLLDQGSASAASPDRSQAPVDGQSTANIGAGNVMNPASGPGGV